MIKQEEKSLGKRKSHHHVSQVKQMVYDSLHLCLVEVFRKAILFIYSCAYFMRWVQTLLSQTLTHLNESLQSWGTDIQSFHVILVLTCL